MHRFVLGCALVSSLLAIGGCTDDDSSPTGPAQPTTQVWQGALVDPILDAALPTYDSTRYVYEITTPDSFTVKANAGYGFAVVETGTWTATGSTMAFTPLTGKAFGQGGATDVTPRAPYSATTSGSTMTIAGFVDVAAIPRPLGTLVLTRTE